MSVFTDKDKLQIFSDLIAIKSVNDHEVDVANYLSNLLERHGVASKLVYMPNSKTRANLVAEIGHGKPVLGFSGHMDVVAAGDVNQWASDPFKLTDKAGQLVGRGATDMKGGLAAMVIAMIELHAQGKPEKGTIRLMATFGEEIGEQGSEVLYEQGYMKDVDALIIGEPSGYQVVYAHKGSMDMRLISHGKAAHSSMPALGYNAIDPLIEILHEANQMFRDDKRHNKILGNLTFNTTIFNGGDQVNSIPASATAEINVRTIPEFNSDEVGQKMTQIVAAQNKKGAHVDLDIYMSESSIQVASDSQLANLAQKLGSKYAGKQIPKTGIPPVTDAANFLKDKPTSFPMIIFGPGNDTPHQINEYVDEKMYLQFTELYQKLFEYYLRDRQA